MLKDLFSAVQKSLSDRVRDPILGSFTGFFVAWNWKPILILLFGSEHPFEARLESVHCLYGFPKYDFFVSGCPYLFWPNDFLSFSMSVASNYGMPMVLTGIYLWGYPYIKRRVVITVQKNETATINAKRAEERSIALTPAESARLNANLDDLRRKLERARKERFELPQLRGMALRAAANECGGERTDYKIGFALIEDRGVVKPGHWMEFIPDREELRYCGEEWHPVWKPCIVTHVLDDGMCIVKVRGNVDWKKWGHTGMELTGHRGYRLSETSPGSIRQIRDNDQMVGNTHRWYVGRSTAEGDGIDIWNTKT